jgi:hypothetical protein
MTRIALGADRVDFFISARECQEAIDLVYPITTAMEQLTQPGFNVAVAPHTLAGNEGTLALPSHVADLSYAVNALDHERSRRMR